VHGDIKWDNLLVARGEGGASRLKIVDWELARVGEPCWDVGSVFGDYLGFWLASIPITGEEPPDRFLQLARYPIEKMQPAMRSFWKAYAAGMGLTAEEQDEWLLRSVRYAAARLLQTAYEQSALTLKLTGNVICLLQLSLNILQRPTDAAGSLLGIPVGWDRAA
jgi:aminoglycoside phosphotransferase (APT) family kinase protein